MTPIYGVLNHEDTHIDTSKTLRGAKMYATLHNYKTVTVRHGYNAFIVAQKINGKWKPYEKSI